jgi:NADH:ubiquinone oxidoreductase subunit 6 (subunit J)
MLLLIPILLCGALGAVVGYIFRFQILPRRIATVAIAVVVFLLLEITSGTLSSKNTLGENLTEQFSLVLPFLFLYLLPAIFGAVLVARRFRTWPQ